MKNMKRFLSGALTAGILALSAPSHAIQIDLNFNFDPNIDPALANDARQGFEKAARFWETRLKDDTTIILDVGFAPLAPNVIGQTGSSSAVVNYSVFRDALAADQTSGKDKVAVQNLVQDDSLSFFTNTLGTFDGGPGISFDSAGNSVFSTIDNTALDVNTANLKALGFTGLDGVVDGSVTFNSDFEFDFNRSDGIDANAFDFIGVAAHEIGHALGFVSGVDFVDQFTGAGPTAEFVRDVVEDPANADFFRALLGLPADAVITRDILANVNIFEIVNAVFNVPDNFNAVFSPMDLFRFSDLSFDGQGNFLGFDLTSHLGINGPLTFDDFDTQFANRTDIPFFSFDGGKTQIAPFSSGSFNGGFQFQFPDGTIIDLGGSQASHLIEVFGVISPFGIMDPTAGRGEQVDISAIDLAVFDVIGFDIPLPATVLFLGLGLIGFGATQRRRQGHQAA
ncbi:NF038122 family metalloprotease [Iodidimonas gelatinilytica]|nr:NF038122 family metalloprotease [Iodidimonas gelatinilytica]